MNEGHDLIDDPDFDHFGECPECGRSTGYVNVGKSHWKFCVEHRTKWCIGYNLFSSWQFETEEEQRAKWDDIGLTFFREAEPVHDGPTIRARQAACLPAKPGPRSGQG